MYRISFDADTRILHVVLSGFWRTAMVAAFDEEMTAATARLHRSGRPFGVLNDASGFPIQSPTVMLALKRAADRAVKSASTPTAIIVGSMLGKLQASRSPPPGIMTRVFFDKDEARRWLSAQLAHAVA